MQAIYKPGETHIQTSVTNGICDFTDGKTPDEYIKELGPDFVCIPLDDAVEQIRIAEEAIYIKPWKEITYDEWDRWLNCLPPQKWQTVNGVNLFQISEHMTSNITLHCARVGDRYFSAYRRTSDSYEKLADEVGQLL